MRWYEVKKATRNINEQILFPFISEKYKIASCRFKKSNLQASNISFSKKSHHHLFYEVHFIKSGYMKYIIDGDEIVLESGDYLLIFPGTVHMRSEVGKTTLAYHLSYALDGEIYKKNIPSGYRIEKVTDEMFTAFQYAENFYSKNRNIYNMDISVRFFQVINSISMADTSSLSALERNVNEDDRLILAKQYIDDNIRNNPKCEDIAKYCFLSVKQLSRIFTNYESVSLKEYINRRKFEEIEKILAGTDWSLSQISDYFGFCNEYYFNKFFKKNAGMCPGEYRTTVK